MIYNPLDREVEDLPVIYGFDDGGWGGLVYAVALAQDGTILGGHACSHEDYIPHDLGLMEGCRLDRQKFYAYHYPGGYSTEFVRRADVAGHARLQLAIAKSENF